MFYLEKSMEKINPYFFHVTHESIFPVIEKKIAAVKRSFSEKEFLNLSIGDIIFPLASSVQQALMASVKRLSMEPIGYGPTTGYDFLKETILSTEYSAFEFSNEELFISDGIISDAIGLSELFAHDARVGIPNPTYPAYLDGNVIAGRSGPLSSSNDYPNIIYLPCTEETGYLPKPPSEPCHFIYLCSPNNPTGVALNRSELTTWVAYAREQGSILLLDAAYCSFISSVDVPKSIYEIPGAKDVAIEMRSFSKSAGFTGLRCSYTVIPKEIQYVHNGHRNSLYKLWTMRQNIKSNGVSWLVQTAARAALLPEGLLETSAQVQIYQTSSKFLVENLRNLGFTVVGGMDSPYIWWKVPNGISSWEFFDLLLERCQIIGIPGVGFGKYGEGYLRLSGFIDPMTAAKALEMIKKNITKILSPSIVH